MLIWMVLHRPQAEEAGPSGATIADGDLVIVYERFDAMKAVTVDAKQSWQNRFGCFHMTVRLSELPGTLGCCMPRPCM